MRAYLGLAVLLSFFVDFLLLMGTNRLCGYPAGIKRASLAALMGAGYAGICLLPGFSFLGNFLWYLVSIVCISMTAFGLSRSSFRRVVVFLLLRMALTGAAKGLHGGVWSVVITALSIGLLCLIGFRDRIGKNRFVPVELQYGGKRLHLTALQDTGNTLWDPVTGRAVLVVGAEAAQKLTGLTRQQLKAPVESMGTLPGLRLVPYRTVGQEGGLLLALKMKDVKIGSWQGSSLVAFAPEGLGSESTYQALTGGVA